ncbi:MAG: glycosyltransferase [Candidatus Sulfobium sp.]|jgi:hyaluronan synthase
MGKMSATVDIREMPAEDIPADTWDWLLRAAILCGLGVIAYASFCGGIFTPLFDKVSASRWAKFLLRPSLMWGAMGALFLFFRTFLWFRYHPVRPARFGQAPFLTVIIPAYNEGPMVAKTIDSVAAAAYPRERLEIFVVDDGSKDDTWKHIRHAAMRHPGLVTTVRFGKNRGKRAALEEGFRKAKGEIAVTIDSDSVISPGTLLAMAGPFCAERVGAVAGKVAVYNRDQGVIPKMLHVKYMLAFDFLRAVQSTYSTVYCCPGALAAYRMSVVRDVLDEWIEQRFLGVRCTYGEDRSLTNYILSRGYDTVYQRNAVVYTIVPRTYSKLTKMFLRWDRSYVREEIRLARIVWRRSPKACVIAFSDLLIKNLRYPIGYATLVLLVLISVSDPTTVLRLMFAIGVMALFNMFYYLRSERSWDFLYGVLYAYFSFFALFWIFPWAVLTVRSRSWMTR